MHTYVYNLHTELIYVISVNNFYATWSNIAHGKGLICIYIYIHRFMFICILHTCI